jgi:hypothetical protein
MRYLCFKASPKPRTPEAKKFGGAYVSCWIKRRSRREALAVADKMIRDYGWLPLKIEAHHLVTRDGYKKRRVGVRALKYFDQACLDREVLVFNTWSSRSKNHKNEPKT